MSGYAYHYNLSPTKLGLDDIRNYQLYLIEQRQLSASSINCFLVPANFHRNPPGLPAGNYCNAFLADVVLQGSGIALNGAKVKYLNGGYNMKVWTFSSPAQLLTSSGTVPQPFQSCARDPNLIPSPSTVLTTPNWILRTGDTGGGITGYRIDVFAGEGRAAINGLTNVIVVGMCDTHLVGCPGRVP